MDGNPQASANARPKGDPAVRDGLFGGRPATAPVSKAVVLERMLESLFRANDETHVGVTGADSSGHTAPEAGASPSVMLGRMGRYTLLRTLGRGGMGVVFLAADGQLGREVAIKLLRHESDDARGRARMLREARALARLSHPNVVQVHEVGSWDEHDFVAMEFVAGRTLERWLAGGGKRGRTWREALAIVVEAGRGLAAAHAVGLVHRDFKPANVMVGDDGRVRVLDFGLARTQQSENEPDPSGEWTTTLEQRLVSEAGSDSGRTPGTPDDRGLTATGAVLGTPAYMSPEQHLGQVATPLSDQFSFCVVLYEALFGKRPFRARTRDEATAEVTTGKFEIPSPQSGVPLWLRSAVLRGLSPDPAVRWPSIDALLVELTRRRRWGWWAGGTALVGSLATAGFLFGASEVEVCPIDAEAGLDGVWDGARRAEVHEAVLRSGLPDAERSLATIEGRLDEQADWLASARHDACEDRWVALEQTDAQYELRSACLDQRTRELETSVRVIASSSTLTDDQVIDLLGGLGDVGSCDRVDLLEGGWLVPTDGADVTAVGEVRTSIAKGHALRLAGRTDEAWAIVRDVEPRAAELDHLPLTASLLYLRGRLEQLEGIDDAREHLTEAGVLAVQHDDNELAAAAWTAALSVSVDPDPRGSVEYRMAASALVVLGADSRDARSARLELALATRQRTLADP